MFQEFPATVHQLDTDNRRGNFIAAAGRQADKTLMEIFKVGWNMVADQNFKIATFSLPTLSKLTFNNIFDKYDDFARSDHIRFWLSDIPAVFITDTGKNFSFLQHCTYLLPYYLTCMYKLFLFSNLQICLLFFEADKRGYMEACYHKQCDDVTHVTDDNIQFLRTTTQALIFPMSNLGAQEGKFRRLYGLTFQSKRCQNLLLFDIGCLAYTCSIVVLTFKTIARLFHNGYCLRII